MPPVLIDAQASPNLGDALQLDRLGHNGDTFSRRFAVINQWTFT
jgi:hypothetical protein